MRNPMRTEIIFISIVLESDKHRKKSDAHRFYEWNEHAANLILEEAAQKCMKRSSAEQKYKFKKKPCSMRDPWEHSNIQLINIVIFSWKHSDFHVSNYDFW